MKACGLIVEYNPFHHGHLYHMKRAKQISNADCMIAVMSGPFLQRGEPAIIDKFHRARAALSSGADIVVELPFSYAVQSSHLFARGAVFTLHALGVSSICFGSESGDIDPFLNSMTVLQKNKPLYNESIRSYLKQGLAYPEASSRAYEKIGLEKINLVQPNNILGFSYVKTIIENNLPITPLTIQRIKNDFHEEKISSQIASATSIRNELQKYGLSEKVITALPDKSLNELQRYKKEATLWHTWDDYFPFLHYRVMTMSISELRNIHGVEEGLEYRIKRSAKQAISFFNWLEKIKTKRYTQVRLQRLFVHLLTNTTKESIQAFIENKPVSYIRLLAMSATGQTYLNKYKQSINVPIISNLNKQMDSLLALDEKANDVYYSVIPPKNRMKLRKQEFSLPLRQT